MQISPAAAATFNVSVSTDAAPTAPIFSVVSYHVDAALFTLIVTVAAFSVDTNVAVPFDALALAFIWIVKIV
tara:strand:- start:7 stop:222 length:216 start_codon:yes stop_codon:yes gene_type:complete